MPLRAKILQRAPSAQAKMSTNVDVPGELPGDEPDDVIFNSLYGIRTIELNRPKKLNSLNGSMARKIVPRLMEWEKSQLANIIIIKGRGDKAFCAGGDVAALVRQNAEGPFGKQRSKDYFALEYQLDHLIATYSKPYVAFMDGITMGGGVGLSVHAPFRIATERTVFAMPETTIGFFPDVGASFFLPRLDGKIGTYLALTSERVTGANVLYAGIATHYLHSSSLPDLEGRLAELTFRDYESRKERYRTINSTIEEFSTGLPLDGPTELSGSIRSAIDRCFTGRRITDIVSQLDQESASSSASTSRWAQRTLQTLSSRCPTSLVVTLAQMNNGTKYSIATAFEKEHLLACNFLKHPDFTEGVSARLIDKPARQPQWLTPTWVSDEASELNMIKSFFQPDDDVKTGQPQRPLQFLKNANYNAYPHAWLGLPTEAEIEAVVKNGIGSSKSSATGQDPNGPTRGRVLRYFVNRREGKQGVREKVREVLMRKTQVVSDTEMDDGEMDEDEDGDESEERGGGAASVGGCIWID